jgi:hypothetical protein
VPERSQVLFAAFPSARLAVRTVSASNGAEPHYEWSAVWTSGVLQVFSNRVTVPPGSVRVGHSYRIRVRMMDDTGRWGHWSAPLRFIPTMESTHSPGDTIISEFMADVAGDDDGREWIELFNTTETDVDLTGWSIGDNEGVAACGGTQTPFVGGDANADGSHDIADVVFILSYIFNAGEPPACMESADANNSETIDIADPIRLLAFLFSDGSDLDPPFGACGPDPAASGLGCVSFAACE